MIQNTKIPSIKGRKHRKQRACWINDQYRCRCGSCSFTIFRERMQESQAPFASQTVLRNLRERPQNQDRFPY